MVRRLIDRIRAGTGGGAELVRGSGISLIARVAAAGVGFLLHFVLARSLDLDVYGTYSFAFSWVVVLSFLGRLGLPNAIVRFAGEYSRLEQWPQLRGLIRYSHARVMVASGVIGLLAAGIVFFRSGTISTLTIFSLILLPIMSLLSLKEGLLRGLKRPGLSVAVDGLIRPALTILFFAAALAVGIDLSASVVMLATSGGAFAALLYGHYCERRVLHSGARAQEGDYSSSREWNSVSLALLLMGGMSLIHSRADAVMLGSLANAEEVAFYTAASRFAIVLLLPLQAVNAMAAPMIAGLYRRDSIAELRRVAGVSGLLIFGLTVPGSIFLVGYGEAALTVFGSEFRAGYSALQWLILGQTINALCGSVAFLMTMTRHQNVAAVLTGLTAALNLFLNWILIPNHGAAGAAMATGIAISIQNLLMLAFVVRKLNIDPTFFSLLWAGIRRQSR